MLRLERPPACAELQGVPHDEEVGRRLTEWRARTSCPDQHPTVFIHSQALALDQFGFQIFQICIVELELPLEGAIGQAPPALEHGYRLVEDLLKGHRPPSLCRCSVQKTV